jgi:hypothetical protein
LEQGAGPVPAAAPAAAAMEPQVRPIQSLLNVPLRVEHTSISMTSGRTYVWWVVGEIL